MKQEGRGEMWRVGLGLGLMVVMASCGWLKGADGADDLANKCGQVMQKVLPCLGFVSGKEAKPKEECCDATESIKETNPECLCYVIQQTHKGSPEIKSLGIQESKLLQLPSVCQVKNASISDCPKLLGLSPSSPDAAIFTNSSKVTPVTPSAQSTTPQSQNASYGSMARPSIMMMMMMTTVLAAISPVFASI
ncbi:unnamed protein product [Sphenostylis stenocarpa]|uniref:Bifunctional inhibitor/plant lipid transfer protein/seed storage helical domain-containing protein n=1 Tax=Sphenostylis stenocarpa TaxID=92480 RepID=A0AA86RNS1_9FABA|nr:unnamed protein product [Sphenostylis stenocarpa]